LLLGFSNEGKITLVFGETSTDLDWKKAFVAQCQEDVDTLNKNVNDDAVLGRKVRVMTWFRPTQFESLVPPPMSPEEVSLITQSRNLVFIAFQMQQYGFDGYALDYIDCPEGIKYFLMKDLNLHRTVCIPFFCFC